MFENLENDISTKDVAETLKKIVPLFDSINTQLKALAIDSVSLKTVAGQGLVKYECRVYKGILKKSVRKIKKKIPVNIEMPTLKEIGNGQVKRIYDEKYKDKPVDDYVDCYEAVSGPEVKAGLIEDKQDF